MNVCSISRISFLVRLEIFPEIGVPGAFKLSLGVEGSALSPMVLPPAVEAACSELKAGILAGEMRVV